MIGYYVHHHGRGHLSRALRLARELPGEVTGLSSLEKPDAWTGPWVHLERDDTATTVTDPTARGLLHWVPVGDSGLSSRMARIAQWLDEARPSVVVCDVSVEVTLLCRLLGVPVACVLQPGVRDDPAHRLGHGVSDLLVAFVPPQARRAVQGLRQADLERLHCLGGVSVHRSAAPEELTVEPRSVVVLGGLGGGGLSGAELARAQDSTPDWSWTVLGGPGHPWVDDPLPLLRRAEVIVTHAGLGALADVALARRPAVVLPQERPHREQECTGEVLGDGTWPALVSGLGQEADWPALLAGASRLDGSGWSRWHDGLAPSRFAGLLREFLAQEGSR